MPGSIPEARTDASPRVIGIGASAGGLEPIEQFFDVVPYTSDTAFVVVQHLSPDFKSMMPQLLERYSDLHIQQITDGIVIQPNTIYLTPPRSSVEVIDNTLRLVAQGKQEELFLPINHFFESLARRYGDNAIGIVLSGTGSDGTLGAKAIAAAGGSILAQDPSTAHFDSMPRSVINAIPDTIYAPPHQLPTYLGELLAGNAVKMPSVPAPRDLSEAEREIVRLLQTRYNLDFGYYKTTTVGRRIMRRAELLSFTNLCDYSFHLGRNPEELENLYRDLLIGTTTFFRDRTAFDLLADKIAANLAKAMTDNEEIRIWVPGCATGEEPYSIAMLVADRAKALDLDLKMRIFATDIHPTSLRQAGRGLYTKDQIDAVPTDFQRQFFSQVGDLFQIDKHLRECVVFSKHNMLKDPPFTRMHLVSCRNLLIYFDEEAQRKAVAMFHFALKKDGLLFLGPSETIGGLTDEFKTIDSRWRIFSKSRDVRLLEATRMLPITSNRLTPMITSHDQTEGHHLHPWTSAKTGAQRNTLLRMYDAALAAGLGTSMILSAQGEVLHIFSDAGRYLQVGQGTFSSQVTDLVDDQLRLVIKAGLDRLKGSFEHNFNRTITLKRDDNDDATISLEVSLRRLAPIASFDDAPILLSLTEQNEEASSPALPSFDKPPALSSDDVALRQRITSLEGELNLSELALQTTIEELENANEELQATNEELQATNEELMAANEELQTVNEELHAVNEELSTVSAEHQQKISELTNLTGDLDNLLSSTDIGVLFLDDELAIRQITPAVSETFNILPRDIGRPIAHVTSRFDFPDLERAIQSVMHDSRVFEKTIHVDGRDYILRILPYIVDHTVNGAVLTFVNITDIARANRNLQQFADIVSHDLKAPLRAIRQTSEWVVQDLADETNEEIKTHTKRLIEQTDRLAQMLSDLRDFSSLQQDRAQPEVFRVDSLLNDIGSFYVDDELLLEFSTDLPTIDTHKTAFRLIFQNLIDNAVKHRETDQCVVTVEAYEGPAHWVYRVSDDGPGIDPRFHDKIFLPFRKLRESIASSGSGIGLALVRKTVEDHGGMITVLSDPQQKPGTTFVVTWPKVETD